MRFAKSKSCTSWSILAEEMDVAANQSAESEAAHFNRRVMKKLQKAIDADPETDLASKLPLNYSSRLADRKSQGS